MKTNRTSREDWIGYDSDDAGDDDEMTLPDEFAIRTLVERERAKIAAEQELAKMEKTQTQGNGNGDGDGDGDGDDGGGDDRMYDDGSSDVCGASGVLIERVGGATACVTMFSCVLFCVAP
jgi:hypothetical protein